MARSPPHCHQNLSLLPPDEKPTEPGHTYNWSQLSLTTTLNIPFIFQTKRLCWICPCVWGREDLRLGTYLPPLKLQIRKILILDKVRPLPKKKQGPRHWPADSSCSQSDYQLTYSLSYSLLSYFDQLAVPTPCKDPSFLICKSKFSSDSPQELPAHQIFPNYSIECNIFSLGNIIIISFDGSFYMVLIVLHCILVI